MFRPFRIRFLQPTFPKLIIFPGQFLLFKLHRFSPGPLCIISSFKASVRFLLCRKYRLDISFTLLLFIKSHLLHILVDRGLCPISKERLIVEVVVVFFSETCSKPRCLVEKTLIVHRVPRSGLSLTQSYFL